MTMYSRQLLLAPKFQWPSQRRVNAVYVQATIAMIDKEITARFTP